MPTALASLACSRAHARSPASAPLTTLVSSFPVCASLTGVNTSWNGILLQHCYWARQLLITWESLPCHARALPGL